jgi:uncharacterized membrane protein YraQ (UPF0718 family)/YHS domain-containing protein
MASDPICGMSVNEKTGLTLQKDGKTYYFCSRHCVEKFAAQHQMSLEEISCCTPAKRSFLRNRIFWAVMAIAVPVLLSYVIPQLVPFRESLVMYVKLIWWAVLLGLFLGGMIDHFIPRSYVSYVLAGKRKRTVVYAVTLGFLMSACSHGILAIAIQLYKKGASTSSVVAFLLASPWANFPLTIMLAGFFGIARALYIIFAAIVISVITGLLYQILEVKGMVETNPGSLLEDESFVLKDDLMRRMKHYHFSGERFWKDCKGVYNGAVALSNMVLWWIIVGVGLASLAGAYVPEHFFHHYMGPTILGMVVTLALATVIEVCSEGSAPLAFEIFHQTGKVGNSFVFLMAGVATDYTEIGLIWHNIGRRAALWLPALTVPQVIFWGYLANKIF